MNEKLYLIGQGMTVLLVGGLLSSVSFALRQTLAKKGIIPPKRKLIVQLVQTGFLFWLLLLAVLAFFGYFSDFKASFPRIGLVFFPPLVLIFFLLLSKDFAQILKRIPEAWFFYIQSFRILLQLILWMGFLGAYVPRQLTFEWLNYDIIVGITGIMAGYVFFSRGRFHRFEGILWNIFGIALLCNIVILTFLSLPGNFRVFSIEPSSAFIAEAPFIWIPGFILPFALAMHLFSLKQLIASPRRRFRFRIKK